MYLFQNCGRVASILVDGRMFNISDSEPFDVPAIEGTDLEKPYTIPSVKVGNELIRLGVLYGIVELTQHRTARGFEFDLEAADAASRELRNQAEMDLLNRYVSGAKADELANVPVKPPSAPIQAVLDARGLDLKRDFGITPVGYKISEAVQARDKETHALKADNEDLRNRLDVLTAQMETFLRMQSGGKATEPLPLEKEKELEPAGSSRKGK